MTLLALGAGLPDNALADIVLYSSGPGTTITAPNIEGGYVSTDDFTLSSPAVLDGVDLVTWVNSGTSPSTVSWEITTAPFSGVLFSGNNAALSNTFLSTARGTYSVYNSSFALPGVTLSAGTYWLLLDNCQPLSAGCAWGATSYSGPGEQELNGKLDPGGFTASFSITGHAPLAVPEPGYTAVTGIALGLAAAVFSIRRRHTGMPKRQST
jgi:hypothetical protein